MWSVLPVFTLFPFRQPRPASFKPGSPGLCFDASMAVPSPRAASDVACTVWTASQLMKTSQSHHDIGQLDAMCEDCSRACICFLQWRLLPRRLQSTVCLPGQSKRASTLATMASRRPLTSLFPDLWSPMLSSASVPASVDMLASNSVHLPRLTQVEEHHLVTTSGVGQTSRRLLLTRNTPLFMASP